MEIDIEGLIGVISLIAGFFYSLFKTLKMGTDVADRLAKLLENMNSGTGKK